MLIELLNNQNDDSLWFIILPPRILIRCGAVFSYMYFLKPLLPLPPCNNG